MAPRPQKHTTITVRLVSQEDEAIAKSVIRRMEREGWKSDLAEALKIRAEEYLAANGFKFDVNVSGIGVYLT